LRGLREQEVLRKERKVKNAPVILNYACSTLVGEFQDLVLRKERKDKHTPVIVKADDIPS